MRDATLNEEINIVQYRRHSRNGSYFSLLRGIVEPSMLVEMALGVLEFLSNKPNWILSKGKSEMSF
jgi:hypothetical protein